MSLFRFFEIEEHRFFVFVEGGGGWVQNVYFLEPTGLPLAGPAPSFLATGLLWFVISRVTKKVCLPGSLAQVVKFVCFGLFFFFFFLDFSSFEEGTAPQTKIKHELCTITKIINTFLKIVFTITWKQPGGSKLSGKLTKGITIILVHPAVLELINTACTCCFEQ